MQPYALSLRNRLLNGAPLTGSGRVPWFSITLSPHLVLPQTIIVIVVDLETEQKLKQNCCIEFVCRL